MTGRDIYGEKDGPRRSAASREAVIDAVKAVYPKAYIEGSTGMMATFWYDGPEGRVYLGSAWERRNRQWYYRITNPLEAD